MMKKEQIASNVELIVLPNDKFKRNRISISFIVPNDRKKATYCASLSASTGVIGQNRSLRFTIQGIKDEYCIDSNSLLTQMCEVLLGIIFKPCVKNGVFLKEWLEVEKVKLREEIEGEINDKRSYCIKSAQRKFFGDSLNGVEKLGYLEEIDGVTPTELFECYKEVRDNSVVNIFVTAENPESIKPQFIKAFSKREKGSAAILPPQIMPSVPTETFEENIDIVQSKVCLIYTTNRLLTEKERYQMLVATSILGGTPSSRLFKNVREKQSLCYYCAAGFNGFTSSMKIDSGVEHQNMQKAIDAINWEIQQLIEGKIEDKEISETKLTIVSSLKNIYDGLHGLEAWYLNENIRGTDFTPEQVIQLVNEVNEKEIKAVLKLFNLNIIYKLTK
ncbi:MAG: insulinase family protein [Oscillospiraceae bacterium]